MSHSLPRTPWIGLSQVAADDEGWWHLTVAAADGTFAVQQECYVYPGDLLGWALQLSQFPTRATDEVRFSIGDRRSTHWVRVRVWLVDARGHAAIAVDLGAAGDDVHRRSASFAITCDVASLNRLGVAVRHWLDDPAIPLREPLYVS